MEQGAAKSNHPSPKFLDPHPNAVAFSGVMFMLQPLSGCTDDAAFPVRTPSLIPSDKAITRRQSRLLRCFHVIPEIRSPEI